MDNCHMSLEIIVVYRHKICKFTTMVESLYSVIEGFFFMILRLSKDMVFE